MDWTNEMVIKFLHVYKTEPILWDLRHEHRKKKRMIADAWRRVHETLDWSCSVEDLKKKKDSLMAYYRIHFNKAKKIKRSDNVKEYKTTWFAYDTMTSFLGDVYDTYSFYQENRPERKNQSTAELQESDNDTSDFDSHPEIPVLPEPKPFAMTSNLDECELYGRLLSQKLMKLGDEDRLNLMHDIDNLVFSATMKAIAKSKAQPSASNISSSSHFTSDSAGEKYLIQVIKSSPPASNSDPLD